MLNVFAKGTPRSVRSSQTLVLYSYSSTYLQHCVPCTDLDHVYSPFRTQPNKTVAEANSGGVGVGGAGEVLVNSLQFHGQRVPICESNAASHLIEETSGNRPVASLCSHVVHLHSIDLVSQLFYLQLEKVSGSLQ